MSKEIDITGNRYGHLIALNKNGYHIRKSGRKDVVWKCLCDCGNITNVTKSNLKNGGTISCGCIQKKNRYKPHRDIIIKQYENYCSVELYDKSVAFIDTDDFWKINNANWHLNASGYASNGKGTPMHKLIFGDIDDDMIIHHKNGNKLDNRKENLTKMSRTDHTRLHNNLKITPEEAEKALERSM